ncbi:Protein pigeon [Armadillidium vulgare]|nr:Protein pigeon [Armadillidium vulgare]
MTVDNVLNTHTSFHGFHEYFQLILYTFDKVVPVVQATVNSSRTLLGFVVRSESKEKEGLTKYTAFVAEIAPQKSVYSLNIECYRQILLEFLKTDVSSKSSNVVIAKLDEKWIVDDQPLTETIVQCFVWAQWVPSHLHLYYLHHRPQPEGGLSLGLEDNEDEASAPLLMLTALQFHSNKPHETVLNVPLELSGLEHSPLDLSAAGEYRDQGLLHSLGDPWLDLRVVTSSSGAICICHHYMYKSRAAETPADPENCSLQPVAGKMPSSRLLTFIDVANDLRVEARVTKESLFNLFKISNCLNTRLSILHMTAVHDRDHDLSRKLMWSVCENLHSLHISPLLQEYLVGETFAAVSKHIDSDASHLLSLLPITTTHFSTDTEYLVQPSVENVRVSYCLLENACIMLLSPRERLVRGQADIWTRLWDHTSAPLKERFSLESVVEKLMVSLDTYKPEALSRGSTPVSPASPLVGGLTISSLGLTLAHLMFDPLPFNETENTASSKLEHLLSVNLRELSMFCLKHFSNESPMRIHAVASKYVSRRLCSILCASQTLVPEEKSEKGFIFIEQLDENVSWRLFALLERYLISTEGAAFPLPQGFNSFFAFLAYRCLSHHVFMQYVKRGVLQLNVDVLREIIYDIDNSSQGIEQKIEIASCVPLVRSIRALQYWPHPESLIVRSRLHAASILAGEGPGQPKPSKGGQKNKTNQGIGYIKINFSYSIFKALVGTPVFTQNPANSKFYAFYVLDYISIIGECFFNLQEKPWNCIVKKFSK